MAGAGVFRLANHRGDVGEDRETLVDSPFSFPCAKKKKTITRNDGKKRAEQTFFAAIAVSSWKKGGRGKRE